MLVPNHRHLEDGLWTGESAFRPKVRAPARLRATSGKKHDQVWLSGASLAIAAFAGFRACLGMPRLLRQSRGYITALHPFSDQTIRSAFPTSSAILFLSFFLFSRAPRLYPPTSPSVFAAPIFPVNGDWTRKAVTFACKNRGDLNSASRLCR